MICWPNRCSTLRIVGHCTSKAQEITPLFGRPRRFGRDQGVGVSTPTMIALFTLVAVALGCTTDVPVDPPDVGGDDDEIRRLLRAHFNRDVLPTMEGAFCQSCHAGSRQDAPAFMATSEEFPSVYDQVLGWDQDTPTPLVNLESPSDSFLLTKGAHEGSRWWDDEERQLIAPWLAAEADFAQIGDQIATEPLALPYGEVVIDLEDVGIEEVPGASIRLLYSRQSSVLRFEEIEITAGPGGLRVTDPVIVPVVDDLPYIDPTFEPSGTTIEVLAGLSAPIIGGIVIAGHLDGVLTDQSHLRIAFLFGDLQPL